MSLARDFKENFKLKQRNYWLDCTMGTSALS